MATGEMSNFLAMERATGAIISTVATLSTKAETMPANRLRAMMVARTFFVRSSSRSAISAGMPDSMKRLTRPMVPAIIIRTLKSIAPKTFPAGRMPMTTKITAEARATQQRYFGNASSKTYVRANRPRAIYIGFMFLHTP